MSERDTKNPAFDVLPHQVSIPVDRTLPGMEFTRKWFIHRNQSTWSTFFPGKFQNDQPVNMIQIGVFEGMDLVWCLQNILGHAKSRVLAIDPWEATRKIDAEKMAAVESRARRNLERWEKKVHIEKGYSEDVLSRLLVDPFKIKGKSIQAGEWDLVVIDGNHEKLPVLTDAIYSLELVRPGGWLVFDDVRNQHPKKNHVYDGLQLFLRDYGSQVNCVWKHRYCDCLEKVAEKKTNDQLR